MTTAVATTTLMNIRLDVTKKQQLQELFASWGLNLTYGINLLTSWLLHQKDTALDVIVPSLI